MICVGLCIDHEVLKGKAHHLASAFLALMAMDVGLARFPLYSMLNPSSSSHPSPSAAFFRK
jgi:hypothetical protein